jgi:hypothetical protein
MIFSQIINFDPVCILIFDALAIDAVRHLRFSSPFTKQSRKKYLTTLNKKTKTGLQRGLHTLSAVEIQFCC